MCERICVDADAENLDNGTPLIANGALLKLHPRIDATCGDSDRTRCASRGIGCLGALYEHKEMGQSVTMFGC